MFAASPAHLTKMRAGVSSAYDHASGALDRSSDRFVVVYDVVAEDEKDVREKILAICLEQTVELPAALVPEGTWIRDNVVGRLEKLEAGAGLAGSWRCHVSYHADTAGGEMTSAVCEFVPRLGCMDPTQDNWNPYATQDDGACVTCAVLGFDEATGESSITVTLPGARFCTADASQFLSSSNGYLYHTVPYLYHTYHQKSSAAGCPCGRAPGNARRRHIEKVRGHGRFHK